MKLTFDKDRLAQAVSVTLTPRITRMATFEYAPLANASYDASFAEPPPSTGSQRPLRFDEDKLTGSTLRST